MNLGLVKLWIAVKELKLSYQNEYIYIYYIVINRVSPI